jgi:superfamily II DNA or RNA helicase
MSEFDELQQALKNKKKAIPLIDIRYAISEFIDCVKGHKKYKDLQKLKDYLLTYPNLDKKFINKQKTKQKIHDYIDKYNEKKCPKGFAKMKRKDLEDYAIKNNIDIGENIRGKAPRKSSGNVFKPLEGLTGITKYANTKEQEEIVKSYENIDPFDVNIKSVNKYGSLTGETTKLRLRNNQTKFIEKMIYSNNRGAIAYWGVGTGKTILTTLTIRNYLHYNPKGKVVFIAPSGLLSNLVETLFRFGLDIRDNRIKYYSFEKYVRAKNKDCENALLVIDEAHNLRTEIIMKDTDPTKAKKGSRAYAIIKDCSPYASKVLLLTATPILNTTYDIENLLAMIDGRGQIKRTLFNELSTRKEEAEDYFKLRVSYFKRTFDDKDFPAKKEQILTFNMTEEETKDFRKIQNLKMGFGTADTTKIDDEEYSSAFFSGQRQFINVVGNHKKMRGVVNHLKKNKYEHIIIYMSFVVKGIRIMKQLLEKENYKVAVVSGEEGAVEKQQSVEAYNTGKINVIIISKAGAEGLDLKNTSALYLLDQPWNEATREQIIGRGVRFKSHESLPPKKRVVDVFNVFLLTYDSKINEGTIEAPQFKTVVGGEERYVKNIIEKIKDDKDYSMISKLIKYNKALEKNQELAKQGKETVPINTSILWATDEQKQEAKRKGIKAKDYYDTITFNTQARDKQIQKLDPPMQPSIDLHLYLFSKAKQYVINVFVKWLNTLPSFEAGISQAEKDIMDKLKVLSNPTDEDKLDIYKEVLKTYINNAGKLITQKNIQTLNTLKAQEKQKDFNKQQKNKWVNKLKQEFFTPDSEIKIIYALSQIEEDKREELKFGELTAGNGAMIQYFFKRHPNLEVRACEIDEENRTHLKNYFEMAGLSPVECLYNEGNLLKLRISDAFDYIALNPPFNLSPQGIYTKKIYDIDFIRKAYVNLKVGGKMVYIMYGNHYLKNLKGRLGEIWEWLDKHTEKHFKRTIKWEGADDKKSEKEKLQKIGKLPIVYGLIIKKDNLEDNDLLEYTNELLIDKVGNPIVPENITMDIEEPKEEPKETLNSLVEKLEGIESEVFDKKYDLKNLRKEKEPMKLWEEIMINQGKRNKIQSNLSNFTKELEENKEILNSLMVNKQQYERRVKLIRKNLGKVI